MKCTFAKTVLYWLGANIVFLLVALLFKDSADYYMILSWIGVIQCVMAILIARGNGERLASPLILYTIVMYMFLFGQCIMWIFTKEYSGLSIIRNYSIADIVSAQEFTLVSFFFFLSSVFFVKKKKASIVYADSNVNTYSSTNRAMLVVGKVLFCVSIVPYIVYNIRLLIIGYTLGYMGLYTTSISGLFQKFLNLREFFFPSVLLIIAGDKENKTLKNILIGMILLDVAVGFYIGSRSDAMMQCFCLALFLLPLRENKTKKSSFGLLILTIALIFIANAVRNVRIDTSRDFSAVVNAVIDSFTTDNPFLQLLGELGGSMATCIETMKLVPSSYGYLGGTSYLYALTWLIPGTSLWEKASMNNWIDNVRYTGAGWGFSTTGEAYFNFGYWGVLVFIIIGVFVGKHIKNLDGNAYQSNPLEYTMAFVLLNRLLIFSRIDFLSTIPSILYFYVLIKIVVILVRNKMNKERKIYG